MFPLTFSSEWCCRRDEKKNYARVEHSAHKSSGNSLKLWSLIMEKQAYEKHISHIDKSRQITVVIGILYKQRFNFHNDFCVFMQMDMVELNWMLWHRMFLSLAAEQRYFRQFFLLNLKWRIIFMNLDSCKRNVAGYLSISGVEWFSSTICFSYRLKERSRRYFTFLTITQ
jgi:hypothetical protein